MNKKLLMTLLIGVLALAMVNAALVFYLSNTIRAEVRITDSIECYFAESGTSYLDLGEIQKTGEPIEISYTQVSDNIADSDVGTFPVTMMRGPTGWEGNEFDGMLICTLPDLELPGVCQPVVDKLFYVDDYGVLHPFSEIGEDDNIYSSVKLFIDYDGNGVAQKYPLASGTTIEKVIITFNPNVASGYYSMQYCHLNEIAEECRYVY